MRIILDLQACQASSMHRGIGRYSMALALAMARNPGGHDLRIVLNQAYPDSAEALRQAFGQLLPQSHITSFATPLPVSEVDPRNAWRVRAAERIREHYLASLRPDIVHVASLFEGRSDDSVASAPHGTGCGKTAVTHYDLIPLMRKERYLGDPNVAAWYYRKIESLRRADLLLAISGSARQEAIELLQLPADSVVNISSAVDAMFRPLDLAPDVRAELLQRYKLTRGFIMYTGGIDYRKNIEGLLEAYAMLPPALRHAHQLAVVCSVQDADRQRLQRLAAKLGLAGDDLVLTGFVPDDDLVALYNCTALFVFPSLHEGFGLPALEAMACGAPVIGSDTSSIPEVIGRADALFDPASSAAICAAMAAVLDDPGREAELRAHGLVQATRFSWDASARRAFDAFEALQDRQARNAPLPGAGAGAARKPRLAYVSPLPPARSGIADYSADLLPELARHYDIELVLAQDGAGSLPYPQRSVDWFDQHAHAFERIVYQFGNSAFHAHMFDLLERHPGVVVLHDFFLSGVVSYAESEHPLPNHYCRTLYLAHGWQALAEEKEAGRAASCLAYPCNKAVLDRATGVIVHSRHAADLARCWYGADYAARLQVLPLLRRAPGADGRSAARHALGYADEEFVLCSFGILSAPKCNERIVEAWLASDLAQDPRCRLVFVGETAPGRFGIALRDRIAAHPRISITGHVDEARYRAHLAAADAAVQLRANSRGETSAGVLDCLAFGLATIVNAHGSAAEVPDATCLRLADTFGDAELRAAIETLRTDPVMRARLGAAAAAFMAEVHAPAQVGMLYRETIEAFARDGDAGAEQGLIAALADGLPRADLLQTAAAIAANRPRNGARQLLVDIAGLGDGEGASGRAFLRALIARPPTGWRIEPVRRDGALYRYARGFTLALIGRADLRLEDAVTEAGNGDVLLANTETDNRPGAWRAGGVTTLRIDPHEGPEQVETRLRQASSGGRLVLPVL